VGSLAWICRVVRRADVAPPTGGVSSYYSKKPVMGMRSQYAINSSICAGEATYTIIGLSESGVFRVPCSVGKPRGFGHDAGSALWRGSALIMGALSWPSPSWIGRRLERLPRRIPQYTTYYARELIRYSSVAQSEPHRKDTSPDFLPQFSQEPLSDGASRRHSREWCPVSGPFAKSAPRMDAMTQICPLPNRVYC
jgi:hypothetical protein